MSYDVMVFNCSKVPKVESLMQIQLLQLTILILKSLYPKFFLKTRYVYYSGNLQMGLNQIALIFPGKD
jgi:hypothetical protein